MDLNEWVTQENPILWKEHIDLLDRETGPHDVTKWFLWDAARADSEAVVTEEMKTGACREAAMAELWLRSTGRALEK